MLDLILALLPAKRSAGRICCFVCIMCRSGINAKLRIEWIVSLPLKYRVRCFICRSFAIHTSKTARASISTYPNRCLVLESGFFLVFPSGMQLNPWAIQHHFHSSKWYGGIKLWEIRIYACRIFNECTRIAHWIFINWESQHGKKVFRFFMVPLAHAHNMYQNLERNQIHQPIKQTIICPSPTKGTLPCTDRPYVALENACIHCTPLFFASEVMADSFEILFIS